MKRELGRRGVVSGKSNNRLLKVLVMLIALSGISLNMKAQVTIGSGEVPHRDALLDLKDNSDGSSSKGLLLPRVKLRSTAESFPLADHKEGMYVYNIDDSNGVPKCLYYNDGVRWIPLVPQNSIFFYAPSVVVPTDPDDPDVVDPNNTIYSYDNGQFTLDLYKVYQSQFSLSALSGSNISAAKNPSASATGVPVIPSNGLDYFVTYFDNTVFTDVSVSDDGKLVYKLAGGTVTEKTFFNIVFKIK